MKVSEFLHQRLGPKGTLQTWEAEARAGLHAIDILQDFLNHADFVVAILTAEDSATDGSTRARQNVVHEVGLFQGKLGFSRVILLMQAGTEIFTNIHGLQKIEFNAEHVEEAFPELEKTLRRERILQ